MFQSDSESELSQAGGGGGGRSLVSLRIMRPTISSQNKMSVSASNKALAARRRALSGAYSASQYFQIAPCNQNNAWRSSSLFLFLILSVIMSPWAINTRTRSRCSLVGLLGLVETSEDLVVTSIRGACAISSLNTNFLLGSHPLSFSSVVFKSYSFAHPISHVIFWLST